MYEVRRLRRSIRLLLASAMVTGLAAATVSCGPAPTKGGRAATRAPEPPVTQQVPAQPEVLMPEEVVQRMYQAMAKGDLDKANSYFVTDDVLTESHLSSWGDPTYQITGTISGSGEGELLMEVTEGRGGITGGGKLTYTLRPDQGFWRISGWSSGPIDYPEPPKAQSREPEFDRDAAMVALSSFFGARMGGDTRSMRKYATARMLKQQPGVFTSGAGSFTKADATSSYKEGEAWVIEVRERWGSATRTREYVIVEQNGQALVDRQR